MKVVFSEISAADQGKLRPPGKWVGGKRGVSQSSGVFTSRFGVADRSPALSRINPRLLPGLARCCRRRRSIPQRRILAADGTGTPQMPLRPSIWHGGRWPVPGSTVWRAGCRGRSRHETWASRGARSGFEPQLRGVAINVTSEGTRQGVTSGGHPSGRVFVSELSSEFMANSCRQVGTSRLSTSVTSSGVGPVCRTMTSRRGEQRKVPNASFEGAGMPARSSGEGCERGSVCAATRPLPARGRSPSPPGRARGSARTACTPGRRVRCPRALPEWVVSEPRTGRPAPR